MNYTETQMYVIKLDFADSKEGLNSTQNIDFVMIVVKHYTRIV